MPSRVLLALGASVVLTALVTLPMAYQAREARSEADGTGAANVEVLGTTASAGDAATSLRDGLYWVPAGPAVEPGGELPTEADKVLLDGSTLAGPVHLLVDLQGIERVDFRLNDDPVISAADPPFTLGDEPFDTRELGRGLHQIVATIQFEDGRNEIRQATFGVEHG